MNSCRPSLPRRLGVSVGSFTLAAALALSSLVGAGIEETEAQFSDTEVAAGQISASWATGGWARSTTNSYTNHQSYWDRTSGGSPVNATETRINHLPSPGSQTNTHGERDMNANFEITTPYTVFPLKRPDAVVRYCNEAANPGTSLTGAPADCGGQPSYTPNFAQTRAKGFGRSGGYANPSSASEEPILWVEAHDIQTMAECAPTGQSRAMTPKASFPSGANNGKIGFMSSATKIAGADADQHFVTLDVPNRNKRTTKWILPNYRLAGWNSGRVYFRATLTSRAYEASGYALSDLYVTLDQYRVSSPNVYLGSFTMVFSRSECGIKTGTLDHGYLAAPYDKPTQVTYLDPAGTASPTDAPLPNVQGALPAGFTGTALRSAQVGDVTSSTLPPTTTVTSPTEHNTASVTTTSAPPNPGDTDESPTMSSPKSTTGTSSTKTSTKVPTTTAVATVVPTSETPSASPETTTQTSTSEVPTTTTPAFVIPDEPGTLAAAAQVEVVDTFTSGEEDLVVVVEGDTVPTDARGGAAALEIWLGGGIPSSTWETFVSTDPEGDGWRWAAINQDTGMVVYVR